MNWSTSVVSSVSSDTEPTILVTFDNAKYVFNVGENTTRTFLQTRKGWRKTRAIFLSQICTDRSAGLPGFLMTISDGGIKNVTIGGPDGLDHFISTLRLFTRRADTSVSTVELPRISSSSDPERPEQTEPLLMYKDENITVFAIQTTPPVAIAERPRSLKRKRSGEHTFIRKPSHERRKPGERTSRSRSSSPPRTYSPNSTSQPSNPDDTVNTFETTESIPLLERLRRPWFTPGGLEAAEAVEWRKLTISHMFGPRAQDQARFDVLEPSAEQGAGHSWPKRIPSPANCDKKLPVWNSGFRHDQRVACSYIVHGPKIRGKFDVAKAVALGLRAGPLRGRVARGETVEIKVKLPCGTEETRIIRPEDCLGAAEKPVVVCVIDCPTIGHIENLVKSPAWNDYHSTTSEDMPHNLHVMYHLAGDGVLENEQYKMWMENFGSHVHHLVANRKYCPDYVTFTGVSTSQLRLHNLDKEMFPLPHFNVEPSKKLNSISGLSSFVEVMDPNHRTTMRPPKAPGIVPVERDIFHEAVKADPSLGLSQGMKTKFEEAKAAVTAAQSNYLAKEPGSDVVVVPFGTGSASPSKYRNVSATFVQIPGYGNVLLDCGEGTYGQLSRHFGPRTKDALRDLRCIFISHIHADHHMGLSRLLAMRRKLEPSPTRPLYLVAPPAIYLYLREYSELEDIGLKELVSKGGVVRILADALCWKRQPSEIARKYSVVHDGIPSVPNSEIALPKLREALGMESFVSVDVEHRTRCFGLVMRHKTGWSLVYSGDTMPSKKLVEAGKGATLLIHEATMSDEQADLAEKKAHSTFGQAINIAKEMQARNVLLTHFSARHPKMPPGISTTDTLNVGIAFDHLRLPLNQVWRLAMYQDAIEESFSDMKEEEDVAVTT